jgi:hypothetical protein
MSTWPNEPGGNARYKVAIPRISGKPPLPKRQRVARACDACRQIKLKCNGHRPSCGYCSSIGSPCLYSASKREVRQISLQRLEERVQDYESVLGDVILNCPLKNLKPILKLISVSIFLIRYGVALEVANHDGHRNVVRNFSRPYSRAHDYRRTPLV